MIEKIYKIKNIKNLERRTIVFLTVMLICATIIAVFLDYYFTAYNDPYMENEIFDLSEGWQYKTQQSELMPLENLRTGPKLQKGETMTLLRTLKIELPKAAILIRANHQAVNVFLDDVSLYSDKVYNPEQNPGMALHFISLPDDYLNKTLKIEITSPYELYSGRTSPILLGTIPSLEAFTLSKSTRPFMLMAICLLLGIAVLLFTFIQGLYGEIRKEQMMIGIFAIIWALYYVCTEYISFQFFTPQQMSVISLGLYFTFQVPLTLFIYFSMEWYKKWMLPAVILHGGFAAVALVLQLFDIVDFPRLLNINNLLLAGLIYTVVLTVLEALKKNSMMILTAPFLIISYISMLDNFFVFYTRSNVVPYSYRDTFLCLILAVLVYSVIKFVRRVYHQRRENEMLSLQKRLANESYEHIKNHLKEVAGLKHEIKNHLTAMQTYFEHEKFDEAQNYLSQYAGQAIAITETVYHDNFLINAILSSLLQSADEHSIKVTLNIKTAPIHIADPDFYSLLSNITNNAIEACAAMPKGKERFIDLTVTRREPYINIRCINSTINKELNNADDEIQTTKTEDGHGYGLLTIRRIVEAYDGIMDIKNDGNIFTIMAAIKDKNR